MSWSSGSKMFSEIIDIIQYYVDDETTRASVYERLIEIFEDYDCDTLDECIGDDDVFDRVYQEKYDSE